MHVFTSKAFIDNCHENQIYKFHFKMAKRDSRKLKKNKAMFKGEKIIVLFLFLKFISYAIYTVNKSSKI